MLSSKLAPGCSAPAMLSWIGNAVTNLLPAGKEQPAEAEPPATTTDNSAEASAPDGAFERCPCRNSLAVRAVLCLLEGSGAWYT